MYILLRKIPFEIIQKIILYLETPHAKVFKKYKKQLIFLNNNRKWFDYDFYMTRKYMKTPPPPYNSPYHYFRDYTYNEFYSARGYQKRLKDFNKKFHL